MELLTNSGKGIFERYGKPCEKKKDRKLPHYLQPHKGQMQHYVAEIHFLSQEVLTKAPSHHYMQYLLGYVCPDKRLFRLDYELQLSKRNNPTNP